MISKKLVTTAALVLGTAALASGHNNVELATDGTGDFLIAPFYEAKNDVCTEVKVFNTNETNSILAKVAIREQVSSQEIDLPIFLSPGDVWSGTICDTYGKVMLRSTDDSNHPAIKEVLAQGKDLEEHSRNAGFKDIDFTRGYIEVYPIAQFNERSNAKVDKNVLVKRWDQLAAGDMSNSKLVRKGVDEDSLSGVVSYQTNDRETASVTMVAFEGAHSKQRVGNTIAYSMDTDPEALLGKKEKMQILELLQNKMTSFTYDNYGKDQSIYLTFPFGYVSDQERSFKITVRDMMENKDIQRTVIFSPAPSVHNTYSIKNELAIIPLTKLIGLTNNSSNYKKGMIQIKEIRNVSDVQLGKGEYASFLPSVVSTMESRENFINTVISAPVK